MVHSVKCNIYLSDSNWHVQYIEHLLAQPLLLLRNCNSLSMSWGNKNARGRLLEEDIDNNLVVLLNTETPQHFLGSQITLGQYILLSPRQLLQRNLYLERA
uniref:Uncharacterized protein n=1 Tax=Photinus pyralis TaxID=7054 RepID=A0A1Y1LCX6_PHOPY